MESTLWVLSFCISFYPFKINLAIFANNNLKEIERSFSTMKKDTYSKGEPTIAEGIDTEDVLNRDATQEEIENGESTSVTVLSLDENDPS
ncbi:hypothetical protein [Neobacillus drentensis]|uniref:hypothetical protein n=2 Tax=Neobacillus drentensis TaxID=220684 RepID=UPI003002B598